MKTRKMEAGEIARYVNPMMMFEENWFLVSASDEGVTNTLTAAWGGFGNVCNKKAATVYIRPQRYTKKFIDKSGRFTMTFFNFNDPKIKNALGYIGTHSGADEPDKIKNAGLTLTTVDGQPTYTEGKYVLVCRPFFRQQLEEKNFLDSKVAEESFPDKDFSVMYIAEIESAYEILD
jgi:flavin reductase (DIM6/NTAB) family NADH-FMN oxidoreductase RutF